MARENLTGDVDPNLAAVINGREGKTVRGNSEIRAGRREKKDKFYVPKDMIPKGWVVEWKRKSCLGKMEEPDYFMDLAEAGWKPAPLNQFRKLMPEDYKGETVERGGLILMIRPEKMHLEAKKLDREEASGQVRDKLMEIGMTNQGEMKRVVTSFDRKYDKGGQDVPSDE